MKRGHFIGAAAAAVAAGAIAPSLPAPIAVPLEPVAAPAVITVSGWMVYRGSVPLGLVKQISKVEIERVLADHPAVHAPFTVMQYLDSPPVYPEPVDVVSFSGGWNLRRKPDPE